MKRAALLLVLLGLAAASGAPSPHTDQKPRTGGRVTLVPKLAAGQTLRYQLDFRSDMNGHVFSAVADPQAPPGQQISVSAIVRLDVLEVKAVSSGSPEKPAIRLRATFEKLISATNFGVPQGDEGLGETQRATIEGRAIEFTIGPDGTVNDVKGLDDLFPEQQRAWRDWFSQIALAAALPEGGIAPGQKWGSEEPAGAPALLAGLKWMRESTYLRNEPCHLARLTLEGKPQASPVVEACAVILTRALLDRKSQPRDPTPEDYRRQNLRTSGTMRGTTESLTYISLATGLAVTVTATGTQTMDVTVATADGANRVRYSGEIKTESHLSLVTESPLEKP